MSAFAWPLCVFLLVAVALVIFKKDISRFIERTKTITREGITTVTETTEPGRLAQTQPLPGRYFTPQALYASLKNKGAQRNSAVFYLIGVYDLTQETGQSCATRGTTTPEQLEQVFISYMDAHGIPRDTLATHAELETQTAAGYAVKAFSDEWPCRK